MDLFSTKRNCATQPCELFRDNRKMFPQKLQIKNRNFELSSRLENEDPPIRRTAVREAGVSRQSFVPNGGHLLKPLCPSHHYRIEGCTLSNAVIRPPKMSRNANPSDSWTFDRCCFSRNFIRSFEFFLYLKFLWANFFHYFFSISFSSQEWPGLGKMSSAVRDTGTSRHNGGQEKGSP